MEKVVDLLRIEDDKNKARVAADTVHATDTMLTYIYSSYTPVASTAGVPSYYNPNHPQFRVAPTSPP
jgi:hypothetical protein